MPLVTTRSQNANVFKQSDTPSGWTNGDLWVDTDDGTLYVNKSGTATQLGNWNKAGTVSLSGGAADDLDITGMDAFEILYVYGFIERSGDVRYNLTFNNDGGANYDNARLQGGTETDSAGDSFVNLGVDNPVNSGNFWFNGYILNLASFNKVAYINAAQDAENNIKWTIEWNNTADQITRIDINNDKTGSYGTNSFMTVLGRNTS